MLQSSLMLLPAHLEGVGDVAGVARAKAEIFSGLPQDGIASTQIVTMRFFTFWREIIGQSSIISLLVFTLMLMSALHLQRSSTNTDSSIYAPHKVNIDINLPLLGKHNVLNALRCCSNSACYRH